MQCEGQKTRGTEGLPATILAESEGGGASAIMENKSLVVVVEIFGDSGEEGGRKVVIFSKKGTGF